MKVADSSGPDSIYSASVDFRAASAPARRSQRRERLPKRKLPSPISLRLTDEERARLEELSEGMTVSAYIRKCVFGDEAVRPRRRSRVPIANEQALARVLALLGASRISNNLNQLAYHANSGSLVIDDDVLNEITEAYRHVMAIRTALIKALGLTNNNEP